MNFFISEKWYQKSGVGENSSCWKNIIKNLEKIFQVRKTVEK